MGACVLLDQVVQSQKIVLKLGISDKEIRGFILSMKLMNRLFNAQLICELVCIYYY